MDGNGEGDGGTRSGNGSGTGHGNGGGSGRGGGDLGLRPLTARSVVLSTLLGHHPPHLPVRSLVGAGELFGIAEGTIRVALSRMVAGGDLEQRDGGYALTARLLERQARQDDSLSPRTRRWRGRWEIAVVTAERRPAAERAALRQAMTTLRLAELREGTWLRPANLVRQLPPVVAGQCTLLTGAPDGDPVRLAAGLWDLDGWARRARALGDALEQAAEPAGEFTAGAAVLRHLLADPLLPEDLLPGDWPGAQLRQGYAAFRAGMGRLIQAHADR
ncbi:PaaX family transcriptional regulator C-terminal domain-containing protein [Streptomyces sp. NPDC047108]|uniref:PaaX family transcriptional regulator C-terminal domain-containing protein n=1 Tax=Streptomyces sp. NPDC047108 TaxID=3155025 RepID=UPI0033C1BA82